MTARSECENLDAFLANELVGPAAMHFATHLEGCDECRRAIEQQRWIDALLGSPASEAGELPPASIVESYRTSLAQRRRHVRLIVCGLAAAASVAIAAGSTLLLNRKPMPPAQPSNQSNTVGIVAATRAFETKHQASFVSGGDTIAVPLESPAADVTVVQLYPTIETERRWRHELILHSADTEPNGG